MRATVDALPLVDETADRDQTVAIAEDDLHELRNLRGVGLVAEAVDNRGRVIEVAPRVEMDDVLGGRFQGPVVAQGGVLVGIRSVNGIVGHAANPQHRPAWAQNRHSKKSRLAAMRGNRSPASVA